MPHVQHRRSLLKLALPLAGLLCSLAALPVASTARAVQLKANVYLSQNKVPTSLDEKGLLKFMRAHDTTRLRETTDEKALEARKFTAEMVTQFNAPPGDLEFHVLFYDIHDGGRKFVEDMSTFIDNREQSVFLQRLKLPRPRFKPNRKMELVVTVRRAEVGSLKFITEGEEVKHSGTVNFGPDGT